MDYCFYEIQTAIVGYFENFTWITRILLAPIFDYFGGSYPSDHLGQQISKLIQSNVEVREFFTSSVFIPNGNKNSISKLNTTYLKIIESESVVKKIRHAIKSRVLPKRAITSLVDEALDQNIITVDEAK